MQYKLDLDFEEIDYNKYEEQDAIFLDEFKKGNFSNLLKQRTYTQEDMFDILVGDPSVEYKLKKSLFTNLIKNIFHIENSSTEKYKEYIRKLNSEIKGSLKSSYNRRDNLKLKKEGLLKFYDYYDRYFKQSGGKDTEITSDDMYDWSQNKENQSKEDIENIQVLYIVSLFSIENNNEFEELRKIFIESFSQKHFVEMVSNIDIIAKEHKQFFLEGLEIKESNLDKK